MAGFEAFVNMAEIVERKGLRQRVNVVVEPLREHIGKPSESALFILIDRFIRSTCDVLTRPSSGLPSTRRLRMPIGRRDQFRHASCTARTRVAAARLSATASAV